jgi:hypothetical protein
MRIARLIVMMLVLAMIAGTTLGAQQNSKPLTNQDVISMVKNLLPESVILAAIKTNDTDFDVSATGLIALKKAAVSSKVMEAMLAASEAKKTAAAAPPPPPPAPAPSAAAAANAGPPASATPGTPTVFTMQGGARTYLTAEATQIVQTKSKQTSLGALAADQALNQALQVGQQMAQAAIMKSGPSMGLAALAPGASLLSGIMSMHAKQAKITYVWALPGGTSSVNPGGNAQTFEVNYGGVPGVNVDQFEPVIVKLSPTPQSTYRLVGATEAAQTAEQSTQQDWPIYSSFIEDRVASKIEKLGPGHAQITPSAAMNPGEYAVAFRPVDKSKKFAGEDVGRNQGEGLLFNYAWSFSVK